MNSPKLIARTALLRLFTARPPRENAHLIKKYLIVQSQGSGSTEPFPIRRTRLLSRPIEYLERRLHLSVAVVLSVRIARSVQCIRQEYSHDQADDATASAHDRRHDDPQHVAEHPEDLRCRRSELQHLPR